MNTAPSVEMEGYTLSFDSGHSRSISHTFHAEGESLVVYPVEQTEIKPTPAAEAAAGFYTGLGTAESPYADGYAVVELSDASGDVLLRRIYDDEREGCLAAENYSC